MKINNYLRLLLFIPCIAFGQNATLSGTVSTSETNEPLPDATVVIVGKTIGTTTDANGHFELNLPQDYPIKISISYIGFTSQEVDVLNNQPIKISMQTQGEELDGIVVSASRMEESILKSPVSIEKMDIKEIQRTPSINFYDGLQNLKGLDMVTSGLTYKEINTRGFNDTGNARFLQLVDGVDNQTPGLSFAVGNLFGSSDLDMESAELIPGSASALYGPVAFNGVLLMRTKDPFKYQGLSVNTRVGLNHFNEQYVNPHPLYDISVRYAKAIGDRFAYKVNASYFTGLDWYATNYTDVDDLTPVDERGENNPARDALNIYGDEGARELPGIGRVSRTGYEERDLMDYDSYSFKLNGALHYRIGNNAELIYQYNYNKGRAAYTGSNRFQLNNFTFQQHRLELKGDNYFIRAYTNIEDSNDSYNGKGLGPLVNNTWVQDLNGNVVSPDQANDVWYNRYSEAFNGNITGVTTGNHPEARNFADQGRFLPGSSEFEREKERYIGIQGLDGAGILSQSKLYHIEGQYDFTNIKIFDLLVGGNFRIYDMFTNGTLFDDVDDPIIIKEGGAFAQVAKDLLDEKLRVTGSLRYDKNQNFKGRLTPRASAVYNLKDRHYLRTSYQSGFRNPTPGDQYIKLNAGPITILGGVPDNSDDLTVYQNSFTTTSLGPFFANFNQLMESGTPFPDAVAMSKDLLVKSDVAYIKPEQVKTFEIGYKGLIDNKILIDANYYFSSYKDFILNQVVIEPESPVLSPDGSINIAAAFDLLDNNSHLYQLYANASDKVTSQGATLGVTYLLPNNFSIGGHVSWADYNLKNADPNDIPAFNTPKFKTSIMFGNEELTKNLGFNLVWRWQDAFDWYGTFNQLRPGRIKSYSMIDAQISYKILPIKSIIKLGANNLINNQVYQAYGSPSIGAVYYVGITFDELLR
ncbi:MULTISPECIES: TonB-dependent receptor [unclassified Arenibacter]|uniref:TonB-dependent receptor n=1 Tax=unclassified Arenibacter TaxID=2615047 RepID=UPI000E34F81B|nr:MULTISPECIES: TonB-dependent receptor [unclassified Arenibacter]MCM4165391.1 TonB-dependent receptor [Arenibacter sp. A80]RFT54868.1 TonB-dependent receptor [Arenibacter sp. P308M17]